MPDTAPILIVEDNAPTRAVLRAQFEALGAECAEAGDGDQAIAMLGATRYSLVILDILLPKRDGLEVLRWMARQEHAVPVVAISQMDGSSGPDYAATAVHMGALKGFGKPIRDEDVAEMMALRRTTS